MSVTGSVSSKVDWKPFKVVVVLNISYGIDDNRSYDSVKMMEEGEGGNEGRIMAWVDDLE